MQVTPFSLFSALLRPFGPFGPVPLPYEPVYGQIYGLEAINQHKVRN